MFKALWTALMGGNPTSWLIMGVAALVYTGAVFGGGYYVCDHMHAVAAAEVGIKAAKAQEDHDKKMHGNAVQVSNNVVKSDTAHDQKIVTIVKTIHDIETAPGAPQNSCDLTPDVAKLLNDAGHYTPAP